MASKFNLSLGDGLLSENSRSMVQNNFRISHIKYEDLLQNEKNFYDLSSVDELVESIRENGLDQNLVVKQIDNNKYKLISGHRRYIAIGIIRNEDSSKFEFVPVKIVNDIEDDDDEIIRIISGNSTRRDMTEYDKMQEYLNLKDAVDKKIKKGETISGPKRAYLSKLLKISETQIQRYNSINKRLIPELKEKFKNNEITLTKAAELSKIEKEAQQKEIKSNQAGVHRQRSIQDLNLVEIGLLVQELERISNDSDSILINAEDKNKMFQNEKKVRRILKNMIDIFTANLNSSEEGLT